MNCLNIHKFFATAVYAVALPLCFSLSPVVIAEEIRIPIGQQGSASAVMTPTSGTSEKQVLGDFGAPQLRSSPVGDPPITRWEYSQFVVYFEYDRVIHSVIKK